MGEVFFRPPSCTGYTFLASPCTLKAEACGRIRVVQELYFDGGGWPAGRTASHRENVVRGGLGGREGGRRAEIRFFVGEKVAKLDLRMGRELSRFGLLKIWTRTWRRFRLPSPRQRSQTFNETGFGRRRRWMRLWFILD